MRGLFYKWNISGSQYPNSMASFERFASLRYLVGVRGRKEGQRFLRFITYVAIGGVAVGVAALLLALAIVRGFSKEIEKKIVGFGSHIQVENMRDEPLDDANQLMHGIAQLEYVEETAEVINEFVLLRYSEQAIEGVVLWGTARVPRFMEANILEGTGDLAQPPGGIQPMLIGKQLANRLGLSVGERVTVFSMRENGPSMSTLRRPRVKQYQIVGLYETSLANFDEQFVFTEIASARQLLGYSENQVTRIDVSVSDVQQVDQTVSAIEEKYSVPVMVRSIYEVYRGLFAWVRLQESIIPLVISVIVLVAAFNIIGTLLMIILEKTAEIGILSSMGASPKVIKRLFLWLGVFVGGTGASIGMVLALFLALLQKKYGIIPLPEEAYYMKTAPVDLALFDFAIVSVLALLLCMAASYFPARFAARIEPLRVIRFR